MASVWFMLAAVATCADAPTVPTAKHTVRTRIALAPRFSTSDPHPLATTAAVGLVMDRVRVVVVRPAADTLADTTVAFSIDSAAVALNLSVAATPGEQLTASLQYLAGTTVLFQGSVGVTAVAPNEPAPGATIVVDYVGPGKTAKQITISPTDGTYTSTTPVQFSYAVIDSGGAAVAGVPVYWRSSDTTVAKVGEYDGIVQVTGKRGTSTISVTMLRKDSLSAHAAVSFVPAPTSLTLASGGGQTGTVGQALAQPVVFELKSSDGGPASGQPMTFAVSSGSVNPASATTDATGHAQTTVTLGTTKGAVTITAQSGTLAATTSATAVAGHGASIGVVSGSGQSDTVKKTLANPFVVKVADAFGNAVSGATVTWTRVVGSGSLSAATTTTGVEGTTQVSYTLGPTAGQDSITASMSGASTPASFVVVAVPASSTIGVNAGLASLNVSPDTGTIHVTDSLALSATMTDATGTVTAVTPVWASGQPGIAGISATGMVSAADTGTVTITATYNGLVGHATIHVIPELTASISAGNDHTCAIGVSGAAYCWGYNGYGGIGDGSTTTRMSPVRVSGSTLFSAISISANNNTSCGLAISASAYCWGYNGDYQFGNGVSYSSPVPNVAAPGMSFSQIVSGQGYECGLTTAGAAYCWGDNISALGDSGTTSSPTPTAVTGGLTFTKLAGGYGHACGLTSAGAAYCWGNNGDGQLGDSTIVAKNYPVPVSGGNTFVSIFAGYSFTCGATSAGPIYCWGQNAYGQFGDGSTTSSLVPTLAAGGAIYAKFSVGNYHACGLTSAGAAYCSGYDGYGQIGDGTSNTSYSPVLVSGGLTFKSISAGAYYTCAVTTTGDPYCWGDNSNGKLGDGTGIGRNTPTRVILP